MRKALAFVRNVDINSKGSNKMVMHPGIICPDFALILSPLENGNQVTLR